MKVNQTQNYNQLNKTPNFKRINYNGPADVVKEKIGKTFGPKVQKALDYLEKAHGNKQSVTVMFNLSEGRETLSCNAITRSELESIKGFPLQTHTPEGALNLVRVIDVVFKAIQTKAFKQLKPEKAGISLEQLDALSELTAMSIKKLPKMEGVYPQNPTHLELVA